LDKEIVDIVEIEAIHLRNKIVQKILQGKGIPPPNAPSTIAKKGSDHTLVDTSEMVSSGITWKIMASSDKVTAEVGVLDEEIAKRALANELGYGNIPERSFLRSTFDENNDQVLKTLSNLILDHLENSLR
jgi:hypothetical protein